MIGEAIGQSSCHSGSASVRKASFQFKGSGVKPIILPLLREQLFVAAAFYDPSMLQHDDNVGVFLPWRAGAR